MQEGPHLQAKKPSSSSLRVGAGKGAPGFSFVGKLTYPPPLLNGFRDCSLEANDGVDVLTGISGSLRLQPKEFIESLKEVEAMTD